MLNGLVGYQLLDDGTAISLGLILISAAVLFIGTGYIALDTGFSWTGFFDDTLASDRSYSLYTLYQLVPLVFLFVFFCLETFLVIRVLGETKPMSMCGTHLPYIANPCSLPRFCGHSLRHCADFPIRNQRSHLQWHERQNQWRSV